MKPTQSRKTHSFLLPSAMMLTILPCITTAIYAEEGQDLQEEPEITKLVEPIEEKEDETEEAEVNEPPFIINNQESIEENLDFISSPAEPIEKNNLSTESIESSIVEESQTPIPQVDLQALANDVEIEPPTVDFIVDGEIIEPGDSWLEGTHLKLTLSNDRVHTIGVQVTHPLMTPSETGESVEFYYVWYATEDDGQTYKNVTPSTLSPNIISIQGPEAERTYSRDYSTDTFNYGSSYYHIEISGFYYKNNSDPGTEFYVSEHERIFEHNDHTQGHWIFSPIPIKNNSYTIDLITSAPALNPVGSTSDYEVVYGYDEFEVSFNEQELESHTYSYQWYRVPQSISVSNQTSREATSLNGEKIEGATSKTLSIEAGKAAGEYLYYVEVTSMKNDNRDKKIENFYSTITVKKAQSEVQISADDLNKSYDGECVAETGKEKNGNTHKVEHIWYNADGTKLDSAPKNAGEYKVVATVAEDSNFLSHSAEAFFTISKVQSLVQFMQDTLDKTYDGECVLEYAEEKMGNPNEVILTWYSADGTKLDSAPKNAGSYKVVAQVDEDINFLSHSIEIPFTIYKVQSLVQFMQDTLDKTYDGECILECAEEKTGNPNRVSYQWYIKDGNGWTLIEKAPAEAGSYKVVAYVDEETNFKKDEKELLFEIAKARPAYNPQNDLFIQQGKPISLLALPEGFSWIDDTQKANKLGIQPFKAKYTPTDTKNYYPIDVELLVNVFPVEKPENQTPIIQANDIFLTLGQPFNNDIALQGVSANDKEDGDLTSRIEIIQNTVDPLKAGVYTITYKVTDKDGASITKTITVTIQAMVEKPIDSTKPEKDENQENKESSNPNKIGSIITHTLKPNKIDPVIHSSLLESSHPSSKKESPKTSVESIQPISFSWSLAAFSLIGAIKTLFKRKK